MSGMDRSLLHSQQRYRSEEHTSELQSRSDIVCRLLLEKKKRLDVAALAFGVNGVEGERGLAIAGDTGDDRQLVMRDLKINVFEVMDPGPAYNNAFRGHL